MTTPDPKDLASKATARGLAFAEMAMLAKLPENQTDLMAHAANCFAVASALHKVVVK